MSLHFGPDAGLAQRLGFHQAEVTPLLQAHWDAVGAPEGCTVFVPLAGKSIDMVWLASRGHRVLGVELSPLAVEQFFAEHGLVHGQHLSCLEGTFDFQLSF